MSTLCSCGPSLSAKPNASSLTLEGLRRRDEMVTGRFRPLVVTLGGGYSLPVERTAEAHAQTFLTAARF